MFAKGLLTPAENAKITQLAAAETAAVNRSLKASTAFLISALILSSSAFFSRIDFRIDA
jgi:hypothetical protein